MPAPRPSTERCVQRPILWHSIGTDIFHVSRSVHAESQSSMSINQQLKLPIFLGWKQAGLEALHKNREYLCHGTESDSRGVLLMVGRVVPVHPFQRLNGHSQEARGASQIGTPFCIIHVARVWRSVCRVTPVPASSAALMTFFHAPCGSPTWRAPGWFGPVK